MSKFPNLKDVCPATSWSSGVEALRKRPEHTQKIMEVIALTAQLEGLRGIILSELTHSKAYFAMLMFEAVQNQSNQRKLLKVISEVVLSKHDASLLQKLERKTEPLQSTRNSFAHSTWAISDDVPDSILLIPGNRYTDGAEVNGSDEFLMPGWVDPQYIQVCTLSALEDTAKEAGSATRAYFFFRELVNAKRDDEHSQKFWSGVGIDRVRRANESIQEYIDS